MSKLVVSVSFRHEKVQLVKEKCIKLTLIVTKLEVFVVFDAISVRFPTDFVLRSNTNNSTLKEGDMNYFLMRTLQRFAVQNHIRMTPNESKKFNIFVFS